MLKREPVIVAALIRVALLVGAKYGLALDEATLMAAWVAIESVIAGMTRARVSPVQ